MNSNWNKIRIVKLKLEIQSKMKINNIRKYVVSASFTKF